MAIKPKKIYVTTPWGEALHVHAFKADVYQGEVKAGDRAPMPTYKVDFKPTDGDIEAFRTVMRGHADTLGFEGKKKVHLGIKKTEEDEIESICPKSQFKPLVFDTKNNPIGEDSKLGPGSVIRARCEVFKYDKGIGLRLLQVQVKKLVPYAGGDSTSGFGTEEEGYVAEDGSSFRSESSGSDTTHSEDTSGDSALDI